LIESGNEKRGSRRSHSSDSRDSEFSLWSDTGGDLGLLADQEDPLSIRLRSFEEHERPSKNRGRPQKHVRYQSEERLREKEERQAGVVRRKEDIRIPSPPPRRISKAERLLVQIMAPRDGPSRMHGLHGKKLMYES